MGTISENIILANLKISEIHSFEKAERVATPQMNKKGTPQMDKNETSNLVTPQQLLLTIVSKTT